MLKRLRLKDFKSFVDEDVPLAPLTLLLGANASGKSNFLDALQFLHANSFDLDLEQILNGEQRASPDAWRGLRGGASEAARLGVPRFTVESDWSVVISDYDGDEHAKEYVRNFSHRMTCQTVPRPLLEQESFTQEGKDTIQTGALQGDHIEISNWSNPFSKVDADPKKWLVSALRSVFLWNQLPPWLSQPPRGRGWWPELRDPAGFYAALERIIFLNIQPSAMRGYGRRNGVLGPEGRNISGVLAHLCDDAETKRMLVDWLAEFCAPEIVDIDFVEVKELGDVMAMFVETSGRRVSARSASDGTLRFLGTLLALRLAPKDSVILLEELDSGLHPTRIRLLVEYLESVTRERGIQVIATTHSPVILQWLSQQTLRNSLVFGRVPEHEGTLVRRLGDLPHFDEVAQHKGIDELFTTGWLEMAL
ncbi:MAG: AAA family ATPase [Cystobacter sp.]